MDSTSNCIFCKKPVKFNEDFEVHMEYHKAKFNREFIFASMHLDPEGMEKTIEFMLSQTPSNNVSDQAKEVSSPSFFNAKNENDYQYHVMKDEFNVKDNIIDDELYEKFIIAEEEEKEIKSRNDRNLEKLIQDDNQNLDNLMQAGDCRVVYILPSF